MKLQYIVRRYTSEVELIKDGQIPLGISIAGSHKDRRRPTITNIKHGSIAHKSHCLSEGDVIVSVGGCDTRGMSKKDVKRLFFKDPDPKLTLRVEYITREACFSYCRVYSHQRMSVPLRKVNGTFGFVLRKTSRYTEYPVISDIKHGADRNRMMCGDKLLAVDNQSLSWIPLPEIVDILQAKEEALFLTEYNVAVVDLSKAKEEISLEINCPGTHLGMTLACDEDTAKITFIHQGSLAQRCGVFHVGDEILTINGINVKTMTSAKANDLLRRFRKSSGNITFLSKGGSAKLEMSVCRETPSSPTFSCSAFVPPNSFASSYYDPVPENVFFKCVDNHNSHNDSQLQIMSTLIDLQTSAQNLQLKLWNEVSDTSSSSYERITNDDSPHSGKNKSVLRFEDQFQQLVKMTRMLVIHVLKNTARINHDFGCNAQAPIQQDGFSGSAISDKVKIGIIDSLNEFANRRLLSKNSAKKLIAAAVDINKNCRICVSEFYVVSFAVRKVSLFLSLNNLIQQEDDTIRHVLKRVSLSPFPCHKCIKLSSTGSTKETHPVQNVETNLISTRTFGVGASSSSANTVSSDSRKLTKCKTYSIRDSQSQLDPHIGFDLSQQTVIYRLNRNEAMCSEARNSVLYQSSVERNPSNASQSSSKQFSFPDDALNSPIYDRRELCYDSSAEITTPKFDSTLTSLTDEQRALSEEDDRSQPSVRAKGARQSTPVPSMPHKSLFRCKSSMGFDAAVEDPSPIGQAADDGPAENSSSKSSSLKTYTDAHEVMLKAENGSFGFILGSLLASDGCCVPIISAIKPKSAAHKCGLLNKGDRIVALNGFGTSGLSIADLEYLKKEMFDFDEVVLTVQFDVTEADHVLGVFTVELETHLKLGLVMDEPDYPSFVRGIVKGSSAHRSGQLHPGDEILSFATINEETLNLQTWTMRKTKKHRLTIRREKDAEIRRRESNHRQLDLPFDPASFIRSGSHFIIKRTSIRTIECSGGSDKMVLEQEFTLFRDPQTWDFGFLFGENPQTGCAYVTDIRPGGPADNSKIIKKYDRILEVNGELVNKTVESSVMTLFMQTDDRVNLVTRRVLHHR